MATLELRTPVALMIFNRPETTKRVFEVISSIKPPKLLVIADGPRPEVPEDKQKCKEARAIIEGINWDCEVLTNYSDVNLGCGQRPATGISWVFEQVEEAIILEDDCLPHPSFFGFCQELLKYYRNDKRIMHISGHNFQFGQNRTDFDYYFSIFTHVGGWASWRRAWEYYDYNISLWDQIPQQTFLENYFDHEYSVQYWRQIFDSARLNPNKTYWDYQWTFTCWVNNALSIIPRVNLISNIGYGPGATHSTAVDKFANLPVFPVNLPLRHSPYFIRNLEADQFTQINNYQQFDHNQIIESGILRKAVDKLRNRLKWLIK